MELSLLSLKAVLTAISSFGQQIDNATVTMDFKGF
jgi:hypothetical protein